MLAVIPILGFLFILTIILTAANKYSRRESILLACIVWGVLIVDSTEFLSLFRALNVTGLLLYWGVVFVFGTIILNKQLKSIDLSQRISFHLASPLSFFEKILLTSSLIIVLTTGLIAIISAPNNWDSMTYHMGCVAHWKQNASAYIYPTNIRRQAFMSPFAEWIILHLQILSNGDGLANLVQWFSFVGCLIGVSLIARHFGLSRRGQITSVAVAATIPMAILQASSTQNNCVATFWMCWFILFFFKYYKNQDLISLLASGSALGLAILTKLTALIFLPPFMIWFAVLLFRKMKWGALKPIGCVILIVLIFNAGFLIRNFNTSGYPLGK